MLTIKFWKNPFEVYDTNNPVCDDWQLNIFTSIHMITHSNKPKSCEMCNPPKGAYFMRIHYPNCAIWPTLCLLNFVTAFKRTNIYILYVITAAGVVPRGCHKKSPRTASIVKIICYV